MAIKAFNGIAAASVKTINGISAANVKTWNGITAGLGFSVLAADFDGTNDYMLRGADLTGNAAGKSGLMSVWARLDGGDGAEQIIWQSGTEQVRIVRTSGNVFQILGRSSAGVARLEMTSTTSYTAGATWRHILASWDLANTTGWLYINDTNDLAGGGTYSNNNIDYNQSNHAVGARTAADRKLNGCMAELYVNYATYLDLSVEANRRKFISATGKPVDLGATGATPTGSQPIVYQSIRAGGAAVDFDNNRGSGGDFTITGTLDLASSSPSD